MGYAEEHEQDKEGDGGDEGGEGDDSSSGPPVPLVTIMAHSYTNSERMGILPRTVT